VRVLICGSRDWDDGGAINTILNAYLLAMGPVTVIEGGARGADTLAAQWADQFAMLGVTHEAYPADWHRHGKAAGPIRNQRMLDDGKPDVVWAFKDRFDWTLSQGGTEDMVRRAKAANIPAYVVGQA
jgi:hypothetical protein